MAKNVITLEFNELTPSLVDRFITSGFLPNFARLRDRSLVAITDAGEEHPNLEPWIQWVTVHTGLSFAEHGVFNLGDGPAFRHPRIWDIASADGRKSWICGSMNAAVEGDDFDGYVLPDPWATDVKAKPEGLFEPYLKLVRTYVQEYNNARSKVAMGDVLAFGRFMVSHGLSLKTVSDIIRQLAGERRDGSQWQRAVILDRLQWDIFRSFYRRQKPALSTFFLNSTAHFQHYFWRNMEPEQFAVRSNAETQKRYADAILFGYRKMDEIVGECLAMAGPETSIVLCTALSQQPMLDHEESGGKQIYKPIDQAALFRFAGVAPGYDYAPVMAEQFHLIFADEAAATAARERIEALRLDDGTAVMGASQDGNRLFCGCLLFTPPPAGVRVSGAASNASLPFEELFFPVEAVRSGKHHPDGMLWLSTPDGPRGQLARRVQLTEVAPTLLSLAGVEAAGRFAMPPMPELAEREARRIAA